MRYLILVCMTIASLVCRAQSTSLESVNQKIKTQLLEFDNFDKLVRDLSSGKRTIKLTKYPDLLEIFILANRTEMESYWQALGEDVAKNSEDTNVSVNIDDFTFMIRRKKKTLVFQLHLAEETLIRKN